MTKLPDTDRARSLLGKRGAFEGVARWPWMASKMGTDDARTTSTNQSRHSPQRVVEKVGRSITNSETPQRAAGHAASASFSFALARLRRARQRISPSRRP
jgi:hypothetical protein